MNSDRYIRTDPQRSELMCTLLVYINGTTVKTLTVRNKMIRTPAAWHKNWQLLVSEGKSRHNPKRKIPSGPKSVLRSSSAIFVSYDRKYRYFVDCFELVFPIFTDVTLTVKKDLTLSSNSAAFL